MPRVLTPRWTALDKDVPEQRALVKSTARIRIVCAGRRAGKSELAKRWLVHGLLEDRMKPWLDPRSFYGAPVYDQAKRIAWLDLVQLIPRNWVAKKSEGRWIRTKWGAEVHVIGLDKAHRIEGVPWDRCIMDESSDIKPKAVDVTVMPCLSERQGSIWRIGVPKRTGIGAAEFRTVYERAAAGKEPDTEAFGWTSDKVLSKEELEFQARHMSLKDYNEQFNARWETAAGKIYYAHTSANVRECHFHPELPLIVGSDFNVDPMCWVFGHRVVDRLEWFDELHMRDCNTPMALDDTWERYGKACKAGIYFYGDATAKDAGRGFKHTSAVTSDYRLIAGDERFLNAGAIVRYPDANPGLANRFAASNAHSCNAAGERRTFIDKRCEHLLADLRLRSYKEGSREPDDAGGIGHMADARDYPTWAMFPVEVDHDEGSAGITTRIA